MFPPTRNARTIMDVARKYRVRFLVVMDGNSLFDPPDEERVRHVLQAYPSALEPVWTAPRYRIFRFTQFAGT
jgi:hypothetical protein